MIKFTLPIKLENNNRLLRMHWATRRKYKRQLLEEIFSAVPNRCNKGAPRARKTVKVLYLTKKLQDPDNFVACLKPMIDCLVDLEFVKDDNPECMALFAEQKKDVKRAYQVIVEVI